MNKYVIIVAGGKGLRMGSTIPKQFLELSGKAILLHTLEKFRKALPTAELFLVLPKTEFLRWASISKGTEFENIQIAEGGTSRFESVKSGLSLIKGEGVVGIHDSVRPFVSMETIQSTFIKAEQAGAAIPVIDLKDSIRKLENGSSSSVDRSLYKMVQTPQCFQNKLIQAAYKQPFQSIFTDDASVAESNGLVLSLVEGNYTNIKITTAEDLKFGASLLSED
ncbi:MAG: 2-C-methyl-D-erythritol 4-phosphate cytidylyltransferase [Flavobacteriales bacterium]|nr:2-C-methyl-D-erythritol 4-phosphate cytidylyltransferase [Flavobacteriales bacterium]